MKTPREILCAKHQTAEPKLDSIRTRVLATMPDQLWTEAATPPVRRGSISAGLIARLWVELVWPCRRVWLGLAAVWLAVMVMNLVTPGDRTVVQRSSGLAAPQSVARLREQRRLMQELMGTADNREAQHAPAPRQPRSALPVGPVCG